MRAISVARKFNRADVDRFLSEMTPDQYIEQVAFDVITEQERAASNVRTR